MLHLNVANFITIFLIVAVGYVAYKAAAQKLGFSSAWLG